MVNLQWYAWYLALNLSCINVLLKWEKGKWHFASNYCWVFWWRLRLSADSWRQAGTKHIWEAPLGTHLARVPPHSILVPEAPGSISPALSESSKMVGRVRKVWTRGATNSEPPLYLFLLHLRPQNDFIYRASEATSGGLVWLMGACEYLWLSGLFENNTWNYWMHAWGMAGVGAEETRRILWLKWPQWAFLPRGWLGWGPTS